MSMAEQLSEKSHQGFAAQNPPCIGLESDLSRNLCWGCRHVYDETPVDLAVYVRNDPINLIDPDGRDPKFGGREIPSTPTFPVLVLAPGADITRGGRRGTHTFAGGRGYYGFDREGSINEIERAGGRNIGSGILDFINKWNKGVNTDITFAQRLDILTSAKAALEGRVVGNCLNFINGMIQALGKKGKIAGSINSAHDLIATAARNAKYDAWGAVNESGAGLEKSGRSFAITLENTIHLGERFFDATLPFGYNSRGGDQTSTLLHEYFHLSAVGNEKQIEESDLNDAAGGNFSQKMVDNCGP